MPKKNIMLCLLALTALLHLTSTVTGSEILRWDFESAESPFLNHSDDCEVVIQDGVMKIDIKGNEPFLNTPAIQAPGPLTLHARIRSGDGAFGRMEIMWESERDRWMSWDNVAMFPLKHDNQWHEYTFALPTPYEGGAIKLRLDTGWKPGKFEIDWMSFESAPLPKALMDKHNAIKQTVGIKDKHLEVNVTDRGRYIKVLDKRNDRLWLADTAQTQALITAVTKTSESSIEIELYDYSTQTPYTSLLSHESEGSLSITLDANDKEAPFWALRKWPPQMRSELEDGRVIFCQRSSGNLLEQQDDFYANQTLTVFGNTDCLDMPWIGVFDFASGDGVMTHFETPTDAFVVLNNEHDGKIWPQVRWRPSMDSFRYQRKMSYRFFAEGGYVAMAKAYRQYVQEHGPYKTMAEKAKSRPNVLRLAGSPMTWGSYDAYKFVMEARNYGMLRATLLGASHGLEDPNSLTELNELGYLTGPYDSWGDFVDGPPGHHSGNVEKEAYHARPGLGPKQGWVNPDGSSYYDRSSFYGKATFEEYVPHSIEEFGFNTRFIDVHMAIDLHEDWHPDHTFDRRQDLAYRREAYEYLNELNLVIGTEHGNDWGVDICDFFEGAAGGPLWWRARGSWNPGQLSRAKDRSDYVPEYLKYGVGYAYSVPLWQLVYHDCTVSTYYWGDCAGYHYEAAPEIATRKDLFNILYATLPLFWRDTSGYDWFRNKERYMQTYHDTTHLHRSIAFIPMVNHEFLSEDDALQQTVFENGAKVTVNFAQEPLPFTLEDGTEITLAPEGYYASGPDFTQTRLVEAGKTVKRLEYPDFVQYQTEGKMETEVASFKNSFTAFKVNENRWQMVLEPLSDYSIDVAALTDWAPGTSYVLYQIDSFGNVMVAHKAQDITGEHLELHTSDATLFAIDASPIETTVAIYPKIEALESGSLITLSTPIADAEIHYTMDGSAPSPSTPLYEMPIAIEHSATLQVQAFMDDKPIGDASQFTYQSFSTLHETGIFRWQEAPKKVELDVTGFDSLRMLVTAGGDLIWADRVNFADAKLIKADGSFDWLSELEPIYHKQSQDKMTVNKRFNGEDIIMDGRKFERGVCVASEAELRYALGGQYVTFEAWVGIDDSAGPNPSLFIGSSEVIFQGFDAPVSETLTCE